MYKTLPLLLLFVVLNISATYRTDHSEQIMAVTDRANNDIIIEKLIEQVADLENYLSRIASKDISRSVRTLNINSAEKLFDNRATIQISSKNEVTTSNPKGIVDTLLVGDYFRKLRDIDIYDKVEMMFDPDNRIYNVSSLGRNKYRVEIEMKQSFRGFKDGKVIYFDVTTKRVDVIVYQKGDVLQKSDIEKIKFNGVIVLETEDLWYFKK